MTIRTKTPVTRQQAAKAVRAHFDQGLTGFKELTDGYFSAIYRLTLADGRALVMKVAPPDHVRVLRYEVNLLLAEAGALALVSERTNLPVPRVRVHDTSRQHVGADYLLMDALPGLSLWHARDHLPKAIYQALQRQAGAALRQINAITGDGFGYFAGEKRFTRWRACFDAMLRGVLADGQAAAVPLSFGYAKLLALAQAHFPALDAVAAPRLVHWDLWDGNLLVDPAGGHLTGILDFERTLWGDPLMEVCFGAMPDTAAYRQGYDADLLAQPGAPTRRLLYDLYLFLIMTIEPTYRGFETPDQEIWARKRLAETIARLAVEVVS